VNKTENKRGTTMVELVWKGKQVVEPADLIHTKFPGLHLSTNAYHPAQSIQNPINPPLSSFPTWHNRLIFGDKRHILPALIPEFAGQVNLIYIDPPFMTGRSFKNGEQLAYSDKWNNDLDTYLQWLYETLMLLKLLLTPDGSLYVHLDWRVTHYARLILDEIFDSYAHTAGQGFKNEIIWHYQSGGRSHKRYARKHDTILFYTNSVHYCFHGERIGERRGSKKRNHMKKWVDTNGQTHWTINSAGRIYTYSADSRMTPTDVWSDISHLHQTDPERNGYATQKPETLLERIILASSEENDLVLDCFCGSGVTPAVAERLNRRWIACDQSELAVTLTRERLLTLDQVRPFVVQQLENDAG
jgi:site-specific DNA-methyltransferase (adenine-specific)/adenine-specific DNA-methyltransferase